MSEDDLDELRRAVAGAGRGAAAHIRLAEALVRAGRTEEAVALVRDALERDVAGSAGELEIVPQACRLEELFAELTGAKPDVHVAPVVGPFAQMASEARVRASDFYAGEAADFGVVVEPTPAKTQSEHLRDLREAPDVRTRVDAATALRGFAATVEVLLALVDALEEPALTARAYTSIAGLLGLEWRLDAFWSPLGVARTLLDRTGVARRIGHGCIRTFVARRLAGDAALDLTRDVEHPVGSVPYRVWQRDPELAPGAIAALPERDRRWAAMFLLSRAATEEEAERIVADYGLG